MGYSSVLRHGLFNGKNILVTGSGSGIGRCIAHELASLGATLLLLGRNEEKLATVKNEIEQDGGTCSYKIADIRDEATIRETITELIEEHRIIHGLVNNAGGQFPARLADISSNGFLAVVKTNLLGGFLVCREVYMQSMIKSGGSIVNITADYFGGMPKMGHSGAARAGMENLTQSAAFEWAKSGVRVNTVAPGYIASSGMDHYEDPDMIARIPHFKEKIPWGRLGTESEISSAVSFLLSDAASYITGATLRIDGGSSLCSSSPLMDLEIAEQHNEPYNGFHRAAMPEILKSSD